MPNTFKDKPYLSPDFPRKQGPYISTNGLEVPRDVDENLTWRSRILQAAENDKEIAATLKAEARDDPLFFIHAFGMTLRVFAAGDDGEVRPVDQPHVPFVPFAVQEDFIAALLSAIENGREILADKSRDMGATWCIALVLAHRLLFKPDESHLVLSRKEDLVDDLRSLPKHYPYGPIAATNTIMGKIDYALSWLPEWMLPPKGSFVRRKLTLLNTHINAEIVGESANATAGSASRHTTITLDEAAKMQQAESIFRSTADVTATRIFISTPNGPGTAFSKLRLSGSVQTVVLPWWEHPEKGAGRSIAQDALGRYYITSPWYEAQKRRRTPKELAIEVDMDHIGAGDVFFDESVIQAHIQKYAAPARAIGEVSWESGVADNAIPILLRKRSTKKAFFRRTPKGRWAIWGALVNGRLDQSKSYVIGCDISKGQGASNSVASVVCVETREKVARFADANTPAYEFARIVAAAALWIGGRGGLPLIVWENNGDPGFDFGRVIHDSYGYPRLYRQKETGKIGARRSKRLGWRSDTEAKARALGRLHEAYATEAFVNHDEPALREALSYVYYSNGGVGPAELTDESASARKTHGDRVIADMLALLGSDELAPGRKKRIAAAAGKPHPQSIAGRAAARKIMMAQNPDRFDFDRGADDF